MLIFAKQRAISLLELMLSLLIIAIVLFVAVRFFETAMQSLNVTRSIDMINNTVKASYTWAQGRTNFSGISIPQLKQAQLLPQNFDTPWQGSGLPCLIDLAPSVDRQHVLVRMPCIPKKACVKIREKMQNFATGTAQCTPEAGGVTSAFIGQF